MPSTSLKCFAELYLISIPSVIIIPIFQMRKTKAQIV